MDTQQIIPNDPIVPSVPVIPTAVEGSNPIPKKSPWPRILSLLCIVALVLAGFFYWQITSLKSQLAAKSSPSPSPSPTASADPTAKWQTYTDNQLHFTIKYPPTFKIDYLQSQPYLDRKITWYVMDKHIDEYRGDGPVVTSKSNADIAPGAIKFNLEYGDVGDKAHQSVMYQIPNPNAKSEKEKYITFSLSSIPVLQTVEETNAYIAKSGSIPLESSDIKVFDQILSTFKFTANKYYQITNNYAGKNIFLVLPDGATISKNLVTLNGVTYSINTSVGPGLCSMDAVDDSCAYTDTQTPIWQTYRIWTNNNNAFALNPQEGNLDGLHSAGFIIQKETPTLPFTAKEMDTWLKIVNNPIVRTE